MAFLDASVKLNSIRSTASSAYQTTVPLATMSTISDVGHALLTAPAAIANEFYSALVNLIGIQLMDTVKFTNPLSDLKKGKMAFGQTIEDIFVQMAKPATHVAGTRTGDPVPDQFAINKAVITSAFYGATLERDYTATIHQGDITRAFLQADPVSALTGTVIQSLLTGEQYDDYRMTVALIARQLEAAEVVNPANKWKGHIKLLTDFNATFGKALTAVTAPYDKDFLAYASEQFKTWSNRLKFVRRDMNIAGVENALPKESQHILMLSDLAAKFDTHLLAWAYNSDKLALGSVREIDAWYSIGADSTAVPVVTPDAIEVKGDMGLGGTKPCIGVIYDPNMVKIYNKRNETENARNARGHYTNIWHTVADIYAASPFSNFVAFYLE